MTYLLILSILMQPARLGPPAECPDEPQPARIGHPTPCTGILISPATSKRTREIVAERDVLRIKLKAQGKRLDLVTLHAKRDGDRLDALIDRGLQLHAKTEAPAQETWIERPGWGTAWGALAVGLISGAAGLWVLSR